MPVSNPFETTIFAGELRRRITIQQLSLVPDEFGGVDKQNWIDVATVWAKIEPLSGRELTDASQIYPTGDTRVTIRHYPGLGYAPGLDPSMRVLDQYGNQYDIVNVSDVDDKHIKQDLLCMQRPIGRDV